MQDTELNAIAQSFWRDGFALIRGVFEPAEVEAFRKAALERTNKKADLLTDPKLRTLLLDDRILGIARAILGETLVYYGDSSVMLGETIPGFHKDNVDKDDPKAPDWKGRYPIIRVGIYTQDHSRNPDGVDLRRGSHELCSTEKGKHFYADTKVGDVIVWNLRTTHSGGSMMLKFPRVALNPGSYFGRFLRRFPIGLLAPPAAHRVAAFMTFGAPSPHLERYIEYLKTREYSVRGWQNSDYPQEALDAAARQGVEVRNMKLVIEREPPRKINKDHVPLPY